MKIGYVKICVFLIAGLLASSCKKETGTGTDPANPNSKISADGFNFATTKNIDVNIRLLSNNNQPLSGVVLNLYKAGSTDANQSIFKAISDANGYVKGAVSVPSYIDTLVIDPNYIGLISNAKAVVSSSNRINAIIGGANVYEGDIVIDAPKFQTLAKSGQNSIYATSYMYPNGTTSYSTNTFTSTGLPRYLAATSDVVDASFLSAINSILKTDVSLNNPSIIGTDVTSVLNITKQSEVSVTYVSSKAAFYNSLGYYTYNTSDGPPTSAANISKITYLFPNCRYVKSGNAAGISAGNKVDLGTIPAGTTIAFVLLQNSWTTNGINLSSRKFYSNSALNPELNTSIKRHNVILHDVSRDVYVVGFEDQLRTSTDNDFNDVVLYAKASTKDAISDANVPNLPKPEDTDGDGVLNIADEFPTDATKAYISYFPSLVNWGTLAFEDNWPSTGDYDLNDLVVSYRYTYTSNAKNEVVSLKGDYAVAAAGASFKNGFGVQFPFSSSIISEVTGQRLTSNYITLGANGLESGQTNAVIIPFDNHESLVNKVPGQFINTEKDKAQMLGDTVHVSLKFSSPQSMTAIGTAPFNPFLISDQRRGYEIHLPGFVPTQKADVSLFGTQSDKSSSSNPQSYYKTAQNWPWAMNFTEKFYYPAEMQSIDKAYPHFLDWAGSTSTVRPYEDWYSNTASGYRNTSNIYIK